MEKESSPNQKNENMDEDEKFLIILKERNNSIFLILLLLEIKKLNIN